MDNVKPAIQVIASRTGVRAGMGDDEISAFERRYGIRIPPDLRMLYRAFGGEDCHDGSYPLTRDGELFLRFWPLEEWRLEEFVGAGSRVHGWVFADFMIETWLYLVTPPSLGDDVDVVLWSFELPPRSWKLGDFIRLAAFDPEAVVFPE